jgi:hypothetical protein
MEIVKRQANRFIDQELMTSTDQVLIDNLKHELSKYLKTTDKVVFIEECLIKIKEEKDEHLKKCTNPKNCPEVDSYNNMLFFAEQELEKNGIDNRNLISRNESITIGTKIDDLILELRTLQNDIERLKAGQQIIYDEFIEQFENLKKQTYLDKKTWRQVFLGKLFEMTMSGIISESLSKKIVDLFGDIFSSDVLKRLTD